MLHDGAIGTQVEQYQFETNNRDPWHHRDEGGTKVPSKADEARLVRVHLADEDGHVQLK